MSLKSACLMCVSVDVDTVELNVGKLPLTLSYTNADRCVTISSQIQHR